jgi:hypothetical protein
VVLLSFHKTLDSKESGRDRKFGTFWNLGNQNSIKPKFINFLLYTRAQQSFTSQTGEIEGWLFFSGFIFGLLSSTLLFSPWPPALGTWRFRRVQCLKMKPFLTTSIVQITLETLISIFCLGWGNGNYV